jgi:CheY-like chemotaxis protein
MDEPVHRHAVVIEDDDDIRHLLETVLSQAGFEVTARANGYDGIEAVRAVNPIVVTLDVNMPGMDGFETAKRIRAFSQRVPTTTSRSPSGLASSALGSRRCCGGRGRSRETSLRARLHRRVAARNLRCTPR